MSSLAGVLPQTAQAYDQLHSVAVSQLGIDFRVADDGGYRDQSDTTRILGYRQREYDDAIANGSIPSSLSIDAYRPIAPFGHSYHNYGAAFDVHVTQIPDGSDVAGALEQLGAIAPSIGLRWGGTFTHPDPYHFELAISLADARAEYSAFTGTVDSGAAGAGGDAFAFDDSGETAVELDAGDSSSSLAFLAIGALIAIAIATFARRG